MAQVTKAGAISFLFKPCSAEVMLRTLFQVLELVLEDRLRRIDRGQHIFARAWKARAPGAPALNDEKGEYDFDSTRIHLEIPNDL